MTIAAGGILAYLTAGKGQAAWKRASWRHGDQLTDTPVERLASEEPWVVLVIPAVWLAALLVITGVVWIVAAAVLRA